MIREIAKSNQTWHFNNEPEANTRVLSKELGINEEILKLYSNWYNIDGTLYYFKEMDDLERVINELLGVKIAKYFKLASAKYTFGLKKQGNVYKTGLLTKSVFSNNKKYENLYDLIDANVYGFLDIDCVDEVLKLCGDKTEKQKVRLQILRMSIMDFYMHQVDRVFPNINFQIKPHFSLAPLYDYSESFDAEGYEQGKRYSFLRNKTWKARGEYIYQSDLLRVVFPSKEMEEIFTSYPEIYDLFLKILDLDLEKYLDLIQKENDFSIPKVIYEYYLNYDKEQKDFVKKIK